MKDLTVDSDRAHLPEAGIFVRALDADGHWDSVDIAHISRDSLIDWLRSRDSIEWPINVVMTILAHPQIGNG